MKIKEINIEKELYPKKLRQTKNPPKKLYVLGDEKILNTDSLSIIGSRCCTPYGAETAQTFAKKLANTGITIVSGMAKGIDSSAHIGAIEAKGKTIAVLGSGFNHIFPDKKIFEKILSNGGAVITEYSKDVGISPQGFRDRNRIVAGLSIGILIIEAKIRSGTGITASYAKEYGRHIFCIPHTMEDRSGIGTNRLLKRGAILVTGIQDILQYFDNVPKIEKQKDTFQIEVPKEYQKVYEQIIKEPLNADEISKKTRINISELNAILTMLELEGYIESMPGNYYKKKD